jgi:DNA-directed RNA polymerase I, II, and III subunit RPABC5
MIIPVKCFTCGKVIGDKYRFYLEKVRESKTGGSVDKVVYLTPDRLGCVDTNSVGGSQTTAQANAMDQIGIVKMCCRRHFLTHVDI